MNENKIDKKEIEIDIQRVLTAVLNRGLIIALVAVLCALLTCVGTILFVTPKYQASAKFYVNNNNISLGGTSIGLSSGDLVTSRNLVDSYIVILKTRETLEAVIDYAGVDLSYSQIKGMISAKAVDETEIFQVTVTSEDPEEAEQIANAIVKILPNRIQDVIDRTSTKPVEHAVLPTSPSSPNYTQNTIIGFLLGLLLSAAVVAIREIFDITIRSEEDVEQSCKHPILAAVPDMTASSKGSSHYYAYGKKNAENSKAEPKQPSLLGGNISFAAAESYKLLRTKLQFSFVGEKDCRVISVSSALSGEGKSLTAINLAYTLSELGKRVILIDCDMRRPTLAEKLKINKNPGLSNHLTGQSDLVDLIQPCGMKNEENAFHVITAGQNPPNPMELLNSSRMKSALEVLRKHYDYVILDLPPIHEVSDALSVANDTDGTLLVVRQNYCDRNVLGETVRQFEFVNAKILGVVFNCTTEQSGKYGKGYYKKYYKKYGKRYYGYYGNRRAYSYADSAERAKQASEQK